jgi:hypothetical protein
MFVEDLKIWTAGEYIFNMFDNCKDSHFFMAADRINHLAVAAIPGANASASSGGSVEGNTILGCQDRAVRVLLGGDMYYETHVDGPVTTVMPFEPRASSSSSSAASAASAQAVVFGTENGLVGQLLMDADTIRKGWQLPNDRRRGAVTAMTHADVDSDGVAEIVVARDDGAFEIYGGIGGGGAPHCIFARDFHESVTGCGAGNLLSVDKQEVVVATFAGKCHTLALDAGSVVMAAGAGGAGALGSGAFTAPEEDRLFSASGLPPPSSSSSASSAGAASSSSSSASGASGSDRVRDLKREVDALRGELEQRRTAYQQASGSGSGEMIAAQVGALGSRDGFKPVAKSRLLESFVFQKNKNTKHTQKFGTRVSAISIPKLVVSERTLFSFLSFVCISTLSDGAQGARRDASAAGRGGLRGQRRDSACDRDGRAAVDGRRAAARR